MSFPKDKPAHSVNVLHKWIATYAQETGQLPERVIRQVSYMVAAQALQRARDEHDAPLFVIKGGVMIELRLGLRARATKDLDAVFRAHFDVWLDQLDDAISPAVGDFTFARTEPEEIKQTLTQRLQLIIDYRGRRWAQVPLEVAPVEAPDLLEIEHAEPLRVSPLGVPEPESVPVVAPGYQIAQKLHACTERFATGPDNDRFRDLMDVLLLRGLLTEADLPRVRGACARIFETRGKHPWPPTVTVYESWREPYQAMARDTHFEIQTVEEAAALVDEMIAEIDAST